MVFHRPPLVCTLASIALGYRARESVMHTLAEMVEWFDVYLKNAEPRRITF